MEVLMSSADVVPSSLTPWRFTLYASLGMR